MENENTKKVERIVEVRKGGETSVVAPKTGYVMTAPAPKKKYSPVVIAIRSTALWVMIFSALVFAMVCIVSIWTESTEILAKSWATIFVIGFAAGFIALIAPLLDKTEQ